ncbi:glycine/sarcosine/betaine reductase complex component C subunit alpha [Natranaerobius trueperi]|uniref:Glycine reductase n=1 Tax=Natranaerobius trueperi TaxID=759412 RepID=A0A226C2T7_9FIRM|nr:glycine/sarcosine/betaine reductase complex component C subunit alpha [Natranaerobius trueperi]OWZ84717.1 glycine reductase [Natranaerobius trueperi]
MVNKTAEGQLSKIFNELADALESGEYGSKTVVCVTTLGSEHGPEEVVRGAEIFKQQNKNTDVLLIGEKVETELPYALETTSEKTAHEQMEKLLKSGEAHAAVTMHYNFPIGVSTVGRVITPSTGKEMLIATTTGSSGMHRVEAMVKNAIYGISAAKSLGIEKPKLGILNVDGAKQVEKALNNLKDNGYEINFAQSGRSDGGVIMRGNDVLTGTPDIMVTDTLTGNILMKMFSAFTTGGSYESLGYGYGPGVGENQDQVINIVSRASGAPVIAGAMKFAAESREGNLIEICQDELKKAEKAGLSELLTSLKKDTSSSEEEEVTPPPKKPVTEEISGIDIMELEDACKVLWKKEIYAESGMGCAGPVVMVAKEDFEDAKKIVTDEGYLA